MVDLNDPKTFKELDPKDVFSSTGLFADQCDQMMEDYFDLPFFKEVKYKSVENIIICGMGGSAYGAHILLSLYIDHLKIPVNLVSDYKLPGFVDEKTLVMVTSYSGSTEEVLSCVDEAKEKRAMIAGFSSGGKLGEILKNTYVGFTFNPKNNPSGQPRLGTGYIVMGTLILLTKLGVINIKRDEFEKAIKEVRENKDATDKEARGLAKQIKGYAPLIFASQHLVGNAHIIRNQFNETSKTISIYEDIPELNHHLMEGLKNPEDKKMKVLFLTSNLYSKIHSRRIELTKDVVSKNDIEHMSYEAKGSTRLSQAFNTLSFGGYITLYLGFLYNLDPSLIPWVDYFKKNLHK